MKAMDRCSVEIQTHTQGECFVFRTAGEAEQRDGALVVYYEQEGDRVELKLTERALWMRRTGQSVLSACFQTGQTSFMKIKLGESEGNIPVDVSDYSVTFTPFNCLARLSYFLFSQEKQHFQLKIKIQLISEGK